MSEHGRVQTRFARAQMLHKQTVMLQLQSVMPRYRKIRNCERSF